MLDRDRKIIRTGKILLVWNIALVIVKFYLGFSIHAASVINDGFNNAVDCASSVLVILSTILSAKKADRNHPYGYGRVENLSCLLICATATVLSFVALQASINDLIHPSTPQYTYFVLAVLIGTIIIKFGISVYADKKGKEYNSHALITAGEDSFHDCITTVGTIASSIMLLVFHMNIERYISLLISLYVLWSVYEMCRDTIYEVLGPRIERDRSNEIKAAVSEVDGVLGVFDLRVHQYGTKGQFGAIKVAVAPYITAEQCSEIIHRIKRKVSEVSDVEMTDVTITSSKVWTPVMDDMPGNDGGEIPDESGVVNIIFGFDDVLQIRDVVVDELEHIIHAEAVIDYEAANRKDIYDKIRAQLKEKYPEYTIEIAENAQ